MRRAVWSVVLVGFIVCSGVCPAVAGTSPAMLIEAVEKALPSGFELDESGEDGENAYAVFKKGPQTVIAFNLQNKTDVEFFDTENLTVQEHEAVFYHAGTEKNGGLVVYLKGGASYLVIGYNKPYMGDEIVTKAELVEIAEKVDLGRLE